MRNFKIPTPKIEKVEIPPEVMDFIRRWIDGKISSHLVTRQVKEMSVKFNISQRTIYRAQMDLVCGNV